MKFFIFSLIILEFCRQTLEFITMAQCPFFVQNGTYFNLNGTVVHPNSITTSKNGTTAIITFVSTDFNDNFSNGTVVSINGITFFKNGKSFLKNSTSSFIKCKYGSQLAYLTTATTSETTTSTPTATTEEATTTQATTTTRLPSTTTTSKNEFIIFIFTILNTLKTTTKTNTTTQTTKRLITQTTLRTSTTTTPNTTTLKTTSESTIKFTSLKPTWTTSATTRENATIRFTNSTRMTTRNSTYSNFTRLPPTTQQTSTIFEYDYSELDKMIEFFGVCNTSVFGRTQRQIVDYIFYASSGWVVAWVVATVIVNLIYKQFGHDRLLDLYLELGFLIIYVFMGVFVLKANNKGLCTATTIILHFFLIFILSTFFMQAFFASSLIKGSSVKNGRLPVLVNYIWPAFFAAGVVLIVYFTNQKYYASNDVHCFVSIYSPFFWYFAIPAWCVWFLVLIRNQISITACRQTRPSVDREQLYWARKTTKGLPILLSWFLMTYFTLLFAVDMQNFWLAIVYVVITMVFAMLLFVLHTYNHISTNNGLYNLTKIPFYRICPVKRPAIAQTEKHPPPAPPPPPLELTKKDPEPAKVSASILLQNL